ncbi:MAG TPA: N-acetylneuraminate synthase family protein [Steroidobacteraceae bacterium]|nr:N-acetylneuraminate synthase family protein [Steroidobacteraceae bacterium]
MTAIKVGDRLVGPGQPAFLAAEIGINHNGDLGLARESIDAAAQAGADGVKFQNYRTEDFVSDRSLTYEYVSQGGKVVEPQYDMFKRCELSFDALEQLKDHCDRRGVIFFSTPTSDDGVVDLVRLKAPLLKNGSDYLVNLALVRAMARTGLPTVVSTGMATLAEIDDAARAFREAGGQDLLLLHCTSSYPTAPADVHLRKIPALASAFGCPVGLSDHTYGIVAAVGAVTLGACFVEKHFTLDRSLPGPDHRFSSDPGEFRQLVDAIRTLEASLGDSVVGPTPSEAAGRRDFRLSCVAARDLPAEHILRAEDIAFRRPGMGLPPKAVHWLVGRRLPRPVSAGKPFAPEDFA